MTYFNWNDIHKQANKPFCSDNRPSTATALRQCIDIWTFHPTNATQAVTHYLRSFKVMKHNAKI